MSPARDDRTPRLSQRLLKGLRPAPRRVAHVFAPPCSHTVLAKRRQFWSDGFVLPSMSRTLMDEAPKKSRSRTEIVATVVVVLVLGFLFFSLSMPVISHGESGQSTKSIANCRQIILSIRLYAADNGGRYPDSVVPDAKDSNTVFRLLFVAGELEDEKIFGAGNSLFVPDGKIGDPPAYARAVEPGENNWAMTKGLDDSSQDGIPLIFESPSHVSWPPAWNADAADQKVKGRAWKGNSTSAKIIIGTDDTSVELMKLSSTKGSNVPLKSLGPDGEDLFSHWTKVEGDGKYEVLDVAVKK